jgi:hypothetical protein
MVDFRELALTFALCRQAEMAREALIAGLGLGLDPGFVRSEPAFRELFGPEELERILAGAGGPPPSP